MSALTHADVKAAADRIGGHIRPVTVVAVDPGSFGAAEVWLACEFVVVGQRLSQGTSRR
ncbi:MAG: hypothetical protein QOI83_2866 [Streptomycetaceae bacterium]|nr:hypothetical protein [Streptomycetaceae bacterium]